MVEKRLLIIPHLSRLIIEGRYLRLCPLFSVGFFLKMGPNKIPFDIKLPLPDKIPASNGPGNHNMLTSYNKISQPKQTKKMIQSDPSPKITFFVGNILVITKCRFSCSFNKSQSYGPETCQGNQRYQRLKGDRGNVELFTKTL